MKKLTTVLAGVGIAVAAIGTLTLPANAAGTNSRAVDSSVSVNALVQGPMFTTSSTSSTITHAWLPFEDGQRLKYTETTDHTSAAIITYPGMNSVGEVRGTGVESNLCMTATAVAPSNPRVIATACDGSAMQQWLHNSSGMLTLASDRNYGLSDPGVLTNQSASIDAIVPGLSNPVVVAPEPVDITGPADGTVSATRNPAFTGTGDEGAEVVLTDANGVELCRTTVVNGVWDCTTTIDLPDGPLDVTATQTATDGSVTTDTVSIVIADPLNSPVIDPAVAGGASIALLAAAGAIIAIRRKQTATA